MHSLTVHRPYEMHMAIIENAQLNHKNTQVK